MLEQGVLNQALSKKNREIDVLNKKNEDMKREYESKVKNLMNSIESLKKKTETMESESHENVRVKIINDLRSERKDQEQVITLLRKFIGKDIEVDKYLIKEFKKNGDQRMLSYEELKIKYKNLENEYKKLKLNSDKTSKGYMAAKNKSKLKAQDSEIQVIVVQKFKHQIEEYENQIKTLKEENESLKQQKEKMESIQTQIFDKIKNYNQELGDIKSVYDIVKKDIQEDAVSKINEVNLKLSRVENENDKLKERIKELIQIGEEYKKKEEENMKKLQRENEIYTKLLDMKKEELQAYKEELDGFKGEINKIDSKGLIKIKRLQSEKETISKSKNELEENMNNLNEMIKHKDGEIKNLKNTINSLTEQLKDKDMEIEMLVGKVEEFEKILQKHKNSGINDIESEYSQFN